MNNARRGIRIEELSERPGLFACIRIEGRDTLIRAAPGGFACNRIEGRDTLIRAAPWPVPGTLIARLAPKRVYSLHSAWRRTYKCIPTLDADDVESSIKGVRLN